ncbi:ZIP family metal transporter [Candidatus Nanohalobium constans]|uniref:ZIP family zinc transporter n=1 Tax=Candidatus Nanohalobium constans TaxID=2565781 RepID=A0A5Q0UIY7_9ARCH|nr:ZIP family metal transporter [Candidatus Nanohalobium constans]QGA80915.1 ZIP family zinc transporter [Candidatus Nanohalobium constans]
MAILENLLIVFVAALITDLATGLGTIPFFFVEEFSQRYLVGMWGLASGIMLSASFLGLIPEGLKAAREYPFFNSEFLAVGIGLIAGGLLVIGARRLVDDAELDPGTFEEAGFKKMVLILGVLTIHSFPEGVAIGVAFAELGLGSGVPILGFAVPAIAITMTIAISIHNIPEGVAISIPFKANGVSNWKTMGAAIFSSVPQPIGAVIAFLFVREAQAFLPIGYGFAAGAMIYLVLTEFVEEAFEEAEDIDTSGWPEFIGGNTAGLIIMILLFTFI